MLLRFLQLLFVFISVKDAYNLDYISSILLPYLVSRINLILRYRKLFSSRFLSSLCKSKTAQHACYSPLFLAFCFALSKNALATSTQKKTWIKKSGHFVVCREKGASVASPPSFFQLLPYAYLGSMLIYLFISTPRKIALFIRSIMNCLFA